MQGSEQTPKAPLGNNARPVQNLHHRTVRTNIDFKQSKVITKKQIVIVILLNLIYLRKTCSNLCRQFSSNASAFVRRQTEKSVACFAIFEK